MARDWNLGYTKVKGLRHSSFSVSTQTWRWHSVLSKGKPSLHQPSQTLRPSVDGVKFILYFDARKDEILLSGGRHHYLGPYTFLYATFIIQPKFITHEKCDKKVAEKTRGKLNNRNRSMSDSDLGLSDKGL